MPGITVDGDGPLITGKRFDLKTDLGKTKLTQVVGELPIEGKPVTVVATGRAKTPEVVALVQALGAAGAPTVLIKTTGRQGLPSEITFTPAKRISAPEACSVVTMIDGKDLSTTVWPLGGGLARRQRKGLAGPDLTHASESIGKAIAGCDSKMAFVSSDDPISWELTYNLAGTVLGADDKKRLETLVLLPEPPVPGRAVKSLE